MTADQFSTLFWDWAIAVIPALFLLAWGAEYIRNNFLNKK